MPNKQSSHYRIPAKKKLGQHFLLDKAVITRIVDAIDPESAMQNHEQLLEIGPGLGAITLPVLARCQRLTAIELDRRVITALKSKAAPIGELTLIEQDILQVDLPRLLNSHSNTPPIWRIFGNLPYNISTPILFALSQIPNATQMIFMLQKEVVERMAAQTGEAHYGRLSVMLALHYDIYPLFDVPPAAFSPPPKVMSAMVGMTRLKTPRWQVDDENVFAQVVKQAFSMRRKTLRNNLKIWLNSDTLAGMGIDPSLRAEKIDGADFATISNYLIQKNLL